MTKDNVEAIPEKEAPQAATGPEDKEEKNVEDRASPTEAGSQEDQTPDPAAAAAAAASSTSSSSNDRLARFRALRARAKLSAEHNLREAAAESQRLATGADQSQLTSIARKHAIASHNLLKADAEAAGEDFERKRAWDWTAEESEKWDRRMAKKARNRDNVYFRDHHQEGNKVYKRQIREMQVDTEAYRRAKDEAVQRAAKSGNLEIVEMEGTGELVAVDKEGNAYSTAENVGFVEKPNKAAVDRLVGDLRKAEEVRMRKRRERGKGPEDADVTYINDKNKQFNQKLARFYDKYTVEIRENFERGTAI